MTPERRAQVARIVMRGGYLAPDELGEWERMAEREKLCAAYEAGIRAERVDVIEVLLALPTGRIVKVIESPSSSWSVSAERVRELFTATVQREGGSDGDT